MSTKAWWVIAIGALCMVGGYSTARAESAHRLGGGVNYWVALDDIESDVDEEGFSYLISYQYRPELLGLEADVEFLPDRFGEDAIAPQAYLVVGKALYAAAGIGIIHQDSDWADDPFYSFKVGLDLEILSGLYLDLSANYRFESKSELESSDTDIDTDTVFLGAALRFGL